MLVQRKIRVLSGFKLVKGSELMPMKDSLISKNNEKSMLS